MSFPQGGSSQVPQSWWAGTGGGADHPHTRTGSSHLLWPQSNPSSLGLTAASLPGPHTAQLVRGEPAAATAPARTPVWLGLPSTLPVEPSARLSPECPTATVALGGLHDFAQGEQFGPHSEPCKRKSLPRRLWGSGRLRPPTPGAVVGPGSRRGARGALSPLPNRRGGAELLCLRASGHHNSGQGAQAGAFPGKAKGMGAHSAAGGHRAGWFHPECSSSAAHLPVPTCSSLTRVCRNP